MIRVLVMGYGPMGFALTRGVLQSGEFATLVGVYPWSLHPAEAHQQQEYEEIAFRQELKERDIPVLSLQSANSYSFVKSLSRLQPDVVLIGSWGEILKPHVLSLSGIRFINCHPSLLPRHRGPNPYVFAILQQDKQAGITFHQMDSGIDTGPILLQKTCEISEIETGGSLRQTCAGLAAQAVPELLEGILKNTLVSLEQDEAFASYDRMSPDVARIDWSQPAEAILRQYRALHPWHHLWAKAGKSLITLNELRRANSEKSGKKSTRECPPGRILEVSGSTITIQLLNGESVSGKVEGVKIDFWHRIFFRHRFLRPGKNLE